jgi:hypothetical protein
LSENAFLSKSAFNIFLDDLIDLPTSKPKIKTKPIKTPLGDISNKQQQQHKIPTKGIMRNHYS